MGNNFLEIYIIIAQYKSIFLNNFFSHYKFATYDLSFIFAPALQNAFTENGEVAQSVRAQDS